MTHSVVDESNFLIICWVFFWHLHCCTSSGKVLWSFFWPITLWIVPFVTREASVTFRYVMEKVVICDFSVSLWIISGKALSISINHVIWSAIFFFYIDKGRSLYINHVQVKDMSKRHCTFTSATLIPDSIVLWLERWHCGSSTRSESERFANWLILAGSYQRL